MRSPSEASTGARAPGLRRLLTPSLLDCLLVSLLAWQFAVGGRWVTLLADGDTGWHIRTGEYVLDHGRWPHEDLFSFSKPGQPWYAWEWLADVIFALLFRLAGLAGVAAGAGLLIIVAAWAVFARMMRRRADPLLAMIVLMLAVGASAIHFLARPHIFTLLFWAVALAWIEQDREQPSARVWRLVPLAALWANMHGGFTALLASLGLIAAGRAAEAWLDGSRGAARWRPALRYAALTAACGAASLANPYGWRLHLHIAAYLRSDWIRNVVDEFQSPKFRSEHSLHFELLAAAALMLVPAMLKQKRIGEALLTLFWAHAALVSARHIPLFAILVAPAVAGEASRLWRDWALGRPAHSVAAILERVGRDLAPGFARASPWAAAGLAAVILATPAAHWPRDFPARKFPVEIVGRRGPALAGARIFTSDQWADYLIYRFYPEQRVYFDGRSDFYGPGIGQQYLKTVQGRPGWGRTLERWDFRFVLAPVDWPLAGLLEERPEWRRLERDQVAVLYERAGQGAPR
jgi:hypothetical protein